MQIATVKSAYEPQLRKLAQDPNAISAVTPELNQALSLPDAREVHVGQAGPLIVSSGLPSGIVPPPTKQKGSTDFETLKIIAQELILPAISTIWPVTKPYVTGVQAVWAGGGSGRQSRIKRRTRRR